MTTNDNGSAGEPASLPDNAISLEDEPHENARNARPSCESLGRNHLPRRDSDSFLSMRLSREWDYARRQTVTRLTKNASFRYKAYLEESTIRHPRS